MFYWEFFRVQQFGSKISLILGQEQNQNKLPIPFLRNSLIMPDPFSVAIGIAITAFCNYLSTTTISRRYWIRNCLTTTFPKKTEPIEYVCHPLMERYVQFALKKSKSTGGMQVVGAPFGSGKTTIICEAVQKFATNNGVPYYYLQGPSAIGENKIHEFLGLKPLERVSDFVPQGSIFVLDQVDVELDEIDPKQRNYLIGVATDGFNNGAFTLIVCVSNVKVFGAMSQYNGGQKIMAMCRPSYVKWDKEALRTYINRKYHSWSCQVMEEVLDLCMAAPTPGLVDTIFDVLSQECVEDFKNISGDAAATINLHITTMVKKWDEFDTTNHTRVEQDTRIQYVLPSTE